MSKLLVAASGLVCALLFTAPVQAATVTVESKALSQRISEYGVATRIRDGVLEYNTSIAGSDLIGMQVKAGFADGSTEMLSWQDMSTRGSRKRGGVVGSKFSLVFEPGAWTLNSASRLTSLMLDAGSGNAFFDILKGKKSGTDGDTYSTGVGSPYEVLGGDDLFGEIIATYTNAIYFRGIARGTDLFQKLSVDYSGLTGGGLLGTTLFKTDIDQLEVDGDLSTIPLPAGLPLMLAGLGALAVLRRQNA